MYVFPVKKAESAFAGGSRSADRAPRRSNEFWADLRLCRRQLWSGNSYGIFYDRPDGNIFFPMLNFFNLLNHANFRGLNTNLSNLAFGTITSAGPARNVQFGLKASF